MARNQHAGPSSLRNRNRVTNKTRLKIIKESIDADPIVLDEDEEKARVVSTAGVDAEDANEHHLQAVLSAAAATRHLASLRSTRGAAEKETAPTAYIPTPDSTGIVDNYEELYPPGRWRDPHEYLKSSDTVEESITFALANGFTYYMDERDEEWLTKNNEEARGEGTSAQGALSVSTTRSGRGTKAKGKDPEVLQATVMSEDEFELVISIFEKVTHEKTEFLHHGLEQGSPFPPFSDYNDTFANPLPPTMFATFSLPTSLPQPPQLLKFAKVVYPYWKERRMERGGHPIIPAVNLDETDTKNDSYICFRRRESKAIRKTRAQQMTYSDKMIRLQSELATAMDLANRVLQREAVKREHATRTSAMWEKRFALADLKRKFPALGGREDEELFLDRERVPKRIKTNVSNHTSVKLRTPRDNEYGSPINQEPMMRPQDRQAMYQSLVDQELAKRKQEDHGWEDVVENPYQPLPVPYASRLFKPVSSSRSSSSSLDEDDELPSFRACRLRVGRGGRRMLDRRILGRRASPPPSESSSDETTAEEERRRLAERWRFDDDDVPAFGSGGPEEHDRKLVDDYEVPYIVRRCKLVEEPDLHHLLKDTMILLPSPDGRLQKHVMYRLGQQQQPMSRNLQVAAPRLTSSPMNTPGIANFRHSNGSSTPSVSGSGIVMPQVKNMMPSPASQARISSSNGAIRPPGAPIVPALPTQTLHVRHSSPAVNGNSHDGLVASMNQDVKMANASPPHASPQSQIDGVHLQSDNISQAMPMTSPMRPKSQTPTMTAIPNGFTIPSVNNYSSHLVNGSYVHSAVRPNGLNTQIMKSAFADSALQANGHVPLARTNATYLPTAYSQQLAAARQMQWATLSAQRPASATLVDGNGVDSALAANLGLNNISTRVPSANGTQGSPLRGVTSPALAHALATGQGRVSPANVARLSSHSTHLLSPGLGEAHHNPSPQVPMPSPSLHSQVVGTGTGY